MDYSPITNVAFKLWWLIPILKAGNECGQPVLGLLDVPRMQGYAEAQLSKTLASCVTCALTYALKGVR